ncbi:MAG: hypothetical protein IT425_12475 [Pirellulales bacterium]|nr:hypothetical protein [Pirellulales bacterium]
MKIDGKMSAKQVAWLGMRTLLTLGLIVGGFLTGEASSQTTGEVREAAPAPSPREPEPQALQQGPPSSERESLRSPYVGPDTYILLDANGHPQLMPGMTYEDFLKAWKQLNQIEAADTRPGYSLERIEFEGEVIDQRAELVCRATVLLMEDGVTKVPLGLVGAMVLDEPVFGVKGEEKKNNEKIDNEKKGDGKEGDESKNADEQRATGAPQDRAVGRRTSSPSKVVRDRLSYDVEQGGLVAHFDGKAGTRRTLELRLVVPLLHDGPETTFPLNCPRAVASDLALQIGTGVSEVRATTGTVVSQGTSSQSGTLVKVVGPVGLFRLTWRNVRGDTPTLASALSAVSTVRTTIDGRGIRSHARITVRSYGGTFDQFRIRLPAGAQLVDARPESSSVPEPAYRIRLEGPSASTRGVSTKTGHEKDRRPTREEDRVAGANDSEQGSEIADGQIIVVELPEKQRGPVVIDLATEQTLGVEANEGHVKIAGFEVLGAVRQYGDIALNVADDWQTQWKASEYMRQVDPSELDKSLQTPRPTAAFQYDRATWSLDVHVARRLLRVHVTPQYEMECLPEEVRLEMRLSYQAFGARAYEFRVALNGWEITGDPIESGSLVDRDRVEVRDEGTLILPLLQASSRRAEVSITLRRSLSRDASRLELPLPMPIADSVGTGDLVLSSSPELELLPDLTSSVGVGAASLSPYEDGKAGRGANRLHFRTLLPGVKLVTDRATRPREVVARTSATISLTAEGAEVEEQIDYSVKYEPIAELTFQVPSDLALQSEPLEVQLYGSAASKGIAEDQGALLKLVPVKGKSAEEVLDTTVVIRAELPRQLLGNFSVRVRYRSRFQTTHSEEGSLAVPLVYPTIENGSGPYRATVRSARNRIVAIDGAADRASWNPSPTREAELDQPDTDAFALYEFVSSSPESYLPLVVRTGRNDVPSTTIIDRAWLQTWLASGVEQTRAAFLFRSTSDRAAVELPPQASAHEFEVLVDRKPAEILGRTQGRLVVRISEPEPTHKPRQPIERSHTLELRTRRSYQPHVLTRYRFTPPQMEGATALSHVYWQIVLPADMHVVKAPHQLVSASKWQWFGTFWGREPLLSQPKLEEWVGASEQLAPTDSQNQYLFTGLLPVATIEVVTGPRWLIVLGASTAALGLVVAWLYVPAVRRRWIIWPLVAAAIAGSIVYPEPSLLAAQASIVGAVLSLLALAIYKLVNPTLRPGVIPVLSASSQRIVQPRSESVVFTPLVTSASTAPTAPLRTTDP